MTDRHVLPPYSLRMPALLRENLEASARHTKRSLNAEIIARLESTFPSPGTSLVPPKIAEQLAQTDSAALAALREKLWQVIDEAITEAVKASEPQPKK